MKLSIDLPDRNGIKSRHRVKNPDGIDMVIRAIEADKTGRYRPGDYGRYVADHGVAEKPEPARKKRKPDTVKRICPQCGAEFEVYFDSERKFCSRSCASRHNTNLRKLDCEKASCVWCGAEFMRSKTYGKKYCSELCHRDHVREKKRNARAIANGTRYENGGME